MSTGENEAEALAALVRGFWRTRGHDPRVWIEAQAVRASATDSERVIWGVRSDMVGGRPKTAPAPADRSTPPKMAPDSNSESPSPFQCLAAIRRRLELNESVRASNDSWRDRAGVHG